MTSEEDIERRQGSAVQYNGNSGQNGTEHKSMGQNYDLQEQSLLNYHELAYFLFRFQVTHNHHNFSAKLKPSSCLGTSTFITVTM